MNLRLFVDSLTLDEMNTINNIIYEKKRQYARENMKPLHEDEMTLVDYGYVIEAIKAYRLRLQVSLLEAKTAVDAYRGF